MKKVIIVLLTITLSCEKDHFDPCSDDKFIEFDGLYIMVHERWEGECGFKNVYGCTMSKLSSDTLYITPVALYSNYEYEMKALKSELLEDERLKLLEWKKDLKIGVPPE